MGKSLRSFYYGILFATFLIFINSLIQVIDFAAMPDFFLFQQLEMYYYWTENLVLHQSYYLLLGFTIFTFLDVQIIEGEQNLKVLMNYRRKHKDNQKTKRLIKSKIINAGLILGFYLILLLFDPVVAFIPVLIFTSYFDINYIKVIYLQLTVDPESKKNFNLLIQLEDKNVQGDSLKERAAMINKPIVGETEDHDMGFTYHQEDGTVIEEGNPQRGCGITGSSGAGKTWSLIFPRMIQTFWKSIVPEIGYSMCTYDYKFPDLSMMSNYMFYKMKSEHKDYPFQMHNLCFAEEQLLYTSRFNSLAGMNNRQEISNSIKLFLEAASTEFKDGKGGVWPKAVKLHVVTIALYLKAEFPEYFTLPHILTFASNSFIKQFKILNLSDNLDVKLSINALNDAIAQGGAEAMVSSVSFTAATNLNDFLDDYIFYVLSGNDFKDLQINRVEDPIHLNIGNNERLKPTLSPIISFLFNNYFLLNNVDDCRFLHTLADESPTVNLTGVDNYINTARSRGGTVTLARQSEEQEHYQYTKDIAAIINGSLGNTYTGQCKNPNIAKDTSDLFGEYDADSTSQSLGKNGNMNISSRKEKIIRPEEVRLLPKGYFCTAVAEGEIENKRAMGKHDVSMYKDIYEAYKKMPLKLGPEVYRQVKKGNIDKSIISEYYNTHPKSKEAKEIRKKINDVIIDVAKKNRLKINADIDSIFEIL